MKLNTCDVCGSLFDIGSKYFKMEGYFIVEKPICIPCCEKQNEDTRRRSEAQQQRIHQRCKNEKD